MHLLTRCALLLALALLMGCGDDNDPGGSPDDTSGSDAMGDTIGDTMGDASDASDASDMPDAQVDPLVIPPYDGTCPTLTDGTITLESADLTRQFELFLPPEPAGAPVLFVYHGNGDNAPSFSRNFDAAGISSAFDAVVVFPHASSTFAFEWPILRRDAVEVELALFDDTLSCLEEAFDVDEARVYSTGFSAGALWTTLLISHRAARLAAAVPFSGGVDAVLLSLFTTPDDPPPTMMTHGGPTDNVVVQFDTATNKLADKLSGAGGTAIVCGHTDGHSIPSEFYTAGLDFLFAHTAGQPSPFADSLDASWPDRCELRTVTITESP